MVLMESHVLYFVTFAAISCLNVDLGALSSKLVYSSSAGTAIYGSVHEIARLLQMFVLGPRLILSVRQYHAKLVTRSDEGIGMTTIAFRERGHMSTSGGV
ncbi:hypothetical protein DFH29DRAFT_574644 [Suillus ampliporus]|nr:hypothetical protein DFH29DRAFT_574644 [Suillus ampliporus]